MDEVEAELLHGQSAQGPLTAAEVFDMTKASDMQDKSVTVFPGGLL